MGLCSLLYLHPNEYGLLILSFGEVTSPPFFPHRNNVANWVFHPWTIFLAVHPLLYFCSWFFVVKDSAFLWILMKWSKWWEIQWENEYCTEYLDGEWGCGPTGRVLGIHIWTKFRAPRSQAFRTPLWWVTVKLRWLLYWKKAENIDCPWPSHWVSNGERAYSVCRTSLNPPSD